jgi:hypothetical protein
MCRIAWVLEFGRNVARWPGQTAQPASLFHFMEKMKWRHKTGEEIYDFPTWISAGAPQVQDVLPAQMNPFKTQAPIEDDRACV